MIFILYIYFYYYYYYLATLFERLSAETVFEDMLWPCCCGWSSWFDDVIAYLQAACASRPSCYLCLSSYPLFLLGGHSDQRDIWRFYSQHSLNNTKGWRKRQQLNATIELKNNWITVESPGAGCLQIRRQNTILIPPGHTNLARYRISCGTFLQTQLPICY